MRQPLTIKQTRETLALFRQPERREARYQRIFKEHGAPSWRTKAWWMYWIEDRMPWAIATTWFVFQWAKYILLEEVPGILILATPLAIVFIAGLLIGHIFWK